MSIKRPHNTPQTNTMAEAMARAGVKPQQEQSQQAQQGANMNNGNNTPHRPRRDLANINSAMRRPMGRAGSGEVVNRVYAGLKKAMEENMTEQQREPFRLIVLDAGQCGVVFSSILVTMAERHQGQEHLACYTLIIEGSANKLNNTFVQIGGQNVEIDVVTGDVYNNKSYWEAI